MDTLGVGMIGYAFMGRAHSQGWRSVHRAFELPVRPEMVAICGRDAGAVRAAASRLGWARAETDWRAVVESDEIDIVDVCTPGSSHAEISLAALEAGKHVICEKPLANSASEADGLAAAASKATKRGVRTMVAFNYRRVPAAAFARSLVQKGALGQIRHVRASYLQDWCLDPEFPREWRFDADQAGSGALGDLASHIVDLSQFISGDHVARVTATTRTFITERPLPDGSGTAPVTVDDSAAFLGELTSGTTAAYEVSRLAPGRKNSLRIEVNGSKGSLEWDLERLNELRLFDVADAGETSGFRTVLVTEDAHPYVGAWWPPGHTLGWEHTFANEFRDFLHAIANDRDASPDFAAGAQVQRVLDAVTRSAESGSWEEVAG